MVKKILGEKKKFGSKIFLGQKKILGQKIFWPKNFFGQKFIGVKKNFGSKIILGQKNKTYMILYILVGVVLIVTGWKQSQLLVLCLGTGNLIDTSILPFSSLDVTDNCKNCKVTKEKKLLTYRLNSVEKTSWGCAMLS